MLSILRHIGKMLLVALLVMSCTSCTRWREAKAVIAEADSLLVYGNIIEDTAVLAATINTFSGPMGYVFARNDLANAYYHMARNFYHAHDYATAADYYILCDRLNPTDPMYKGRVNSCMGFLCKQDSCFEEALEFYERANNAFEKTGDKRRVIECLTEDLIAMLMDTYGVSLDEAADKLYNFHTYSLLENEDSGLYYQSAVYVFDMLQEELELLV